MANTGFLQASTDLDYILIGNDQTTLDLVPYRYRKPSPSFQSFGYLYYTSTSESVYYRRHVENTTAIGNDYSISFDWKTISSGSVGLDFRIGIKAGDDSLWGWGYNNWRQLGVSVGYIAYNPYYQGTYYVQQNPTYPLRLSTLRWKKVTCGGYTTAGITTDGKLYNWGYSFNGANGSASSTVSFITQLGTDTNWSDISSGHDYHMAIKSNGTLWGWGRNAEGQLGQTVSNNYSVPNANDQVTTWSKVACGYRHTLGIKTNGTLWGWGSNVNGQLGQGSTIPGQISSPVQIGTGTNWAQIATYISHSLAIKTDGTLWAWGSNTSGELGLGTTTSTSSPVQVGALTDWSRLFRAGNTSFATKTDGTLWAWGYNFDGSGNKSSPVQAGLKRSGWTHVDQQPDTQSNLKWYALGL